MSLTVDSGQTLQRCLALDIGGTKIASAIVKNGEIQQRKQISTPQDNAAQVMHQTLAQLLKEYEGQFDYVAVASTGIINQGILTALNPKNLGGLAQFPLKDSIAQHTVKPVGLLNDVQAAAYAEYQLQNPNDVQNFTFITVSTGVGGGLILNHRLLTEPNGIAGHIGHTLADPNGPICGCGRRGCVEAIASGRAIEAVSSKWAAISAKGDCTARSGFNKIASAIFFSVFVKLRYNELMVFKILPFLAINHSRTFCL